jgi:hypothetical protein
MLSQPDPLAQEEDIMRRFVGGTLAAVALALTYLVAVPQPSFAAPCVETGCTGLPLAPGVLGRAG